MAKSLVQYVQYVYMQEGHVQALESPQIEIFFVDQVALYV